MVFVFLSACMCVFVYLFVCRSEDSFRSGFSPSTMWVLGIELSLSCKNLYLMNHISSSIIGGFGSSLGHISLGQSPHLLLPTSLRLS